MAEERTVSHTGSVLGPDHVTLEQNQGNPDRRDTVISFECPDMFEELEYNGAQHPVRFEPRTMEEFDADGDTYELDADLQPVAGETEVEDQSYPVVVAAEVGGEEIAVVDVDYHANEVTLAEAPTGSVKLYPIMTAGTVKWGGENALGQDQGTLYPWGFPVFRFHDMEQIRSGREITMQGAAAWGHNEELQLRLQSEQTIVWEDDDYPDSYVSHIEIDLRIYL